MFSFVLIGFSKWRKQLMRKTSVSLLPRGQWVCDKSRAFRVRKKKKKLCAFASLRLKKGRGFARVARIFLHFL